VPREPSEFSVHVTEGESLPDPSPREVMVQDLVMPRRAWSVGGASQSRQKSQIFCVGGHLSKHPVSNHLNREKAWRSLVNAVADDDSVV